MHARVLLPDELDKLGDSLYAKALDARRGHFVVVEDEAGAIIGRMMFVLVPHVEGLWIAPAHRKRGAVMRHLLRAFHATGRWFGVNAMMGSVASPEMHHVLADHLGGTHIDASHYVIPIEQQDACHG